MNISSIYSHIISILLILVISTKANGQIPVNSAAVSAFGTAGEGDLYQDENNVVYIGMQDGSLRRIWPDTLTALSFSNDSLRYQDENGDVTAIPFDATGGNDHDFYEVGTNNPPDNITDNVWTRGSISFGDHNLGTPAIGNNSIRGGQNNQVSATNAAAFGQGNNVSGAHSMAIGRSNSTLVGANAFVFGTSNTLNAGSDQSIVGGQTNTVSATNSFVIGQTNQVSGGEQGVWGIGNQVSGQSNGVFGQGNISSGTNSLVFGENNNLSHNSAAAIGRGATTSTNNQFVAEFDGDILLNPTSAQNGNVGIGLTGPDRMLVINSNRSSTSTQSSLRFNGFNSATAATTGSAPLGVNAGGDVVIYKPEFEIVAAGKVDAAGNGVKINGATVMRVTTNNTSGGNANGDYMITFDQPRPDANYIIQLSMIDRNGGGADDPGITYYQQTAAGFKVNIGDNDNGGTDRGDYNSEFMFLVIDF